MDMAYASPRLPKMETTHLHITAPIRPPVSLHAPHAREGAAGYPASYAHHDTQLF